MLRSSLHRLIALTLTGATIAAAACSDDAGSVDPIPKASTKTGALGGTDSSGSTPTPTPPTSNGPVVSVRVTPQQAVLALGNYLEVVAVGLDEAGEVVGGTIRRTAFRSSDASIVAVVGDTGTVVARAIGTAKVYATIDEHVDSATITVVPGPATPPPPTSQPGVSSFDLTVSVAGALSGADTTQKTPIAGALVKLTRIGGVAGDTLTTSVDAGSGTTNANGTVSFSGLAGGAYMVDITPPAGSSYDGAKTGFGPPHEDHVNFAAVLQPKH